jgi:hypothetical protein
LACFSNIARNAPQVKPFRRHVRRTAAQAQTARKSIENTSLMNSKKDHLEMDQRHVIFSEQH